MNFSREERLLTGAALVMCAVIILFNAFDSAYIGRTLINTASPDRNTISSQTNISRDNNTNSISFDNNENSSSDTESEKENADGKVININTASALELKEFLPGIGDIKAQAIVDYRKQIGGFTSVSQLLDVKGIGEKTYSNIRNLCSVE